MTREKTLGFIVGQRITGVTLAPSDSIPDALDVVSMTLDNDVVLNIGEPVRVVVPYKTLWPEAVVPNSTIVAECTSCGRGIREVEPNDLICGQRLCIKCRAMMKNARLYQDEAHWRGRNITGQGSVDIGG